MIAVAGSLVGFARFVEVAEMAIDTDVAGNM